MGVDAGANEPAARSGYLSVDGAALYWREAGAGSPVVVLHGGPDFNHTYLLPELDRLAGSFRLVYYDQRGRGRSAAGVRPEDVSIASEVADQDTLRAHLGLESMALLGHSWGGLLALEYALRHPERVDRLILMNGAPVSHAGAMLFRRHGEVVRDMARLRELDASPAYAAGDPDAVAAYYRVHFRPALRRPEHLDRIVERLRRSFTPEGVLLARAIEDRLYTETWGEEGYDLLPALGRLDIPALVLHGDRDTVPVEIAEDIARALPGGRLVVLPDCGHFAFLEAPDAVEREIVAFMASG
jgi:proline iminopeptidase